MSISIHYHPGGLVQHNMWINDSITDACDAIYYAVYQERSDPPLIPLDNKMWLLSLKSLS